MSGELLFERDEEMGTVTTFLYDESNDTFRLREQQDVGAIVEINKYLAKMGRPKGDVRKVGSMPLTLLGEMWNSWRQRNLSQEERQVELAAWLNNSDNAAWRTDGRMKL
jgi:hypothetical protein